MNLNPEALKIRLQINKNYKKKSDTTYLSMQRMVQRLLGPDAIEIMKLFKKTCVSKKIYKHQYTISRYVIMNAAIQ